MWGNINTNFRGSLERDLPIRFRSLILFFFILTVSFLFWFMHVLTYDALTNMVTFRF